MATTANGRVHQLSDTVRYMKNPVETLGPSVSAYQGPIPRIRTKQSDQKPLKRFDTFGENAIEAIYDSFRFLDEPDAPSPASSGQAILKEKQKRRKRPSPSHLAYSVLSFIQFACSATFLIIALFRFWKNFKGRSNYVDFDRPEGFDLLKPEGLRLLKERTAASVVLPAFFQLIASIFGFWRVLGKHQRPMQILQLVFSLLAVFLWLRAAEAIGIEMNVSLVQLKNDNEELALPIYTLGLAVASFETIVLPSIAVVMIGQDLLGQRRHPRAFCSISVSIGTALVSAASVCFSAFATTRTLSVLAAPPNGSNQSIFFAFGLRELLSSGHTLLCAIFSFFASLHGDMGLSVAAACLQLTNLLTLSSFCLSGARITSVVSNSALLDSGGGPLALPNVVLLYSLLGALLLLLSCQLIATTFSIRSKEKNGKRPPPSVGERTSF